MRQIHSAAIVRILSILVLCLVARRRWFEMM